MQMGRARGAVSVPLSPPPPLGPETAREARQLAAPIPTSCAARRPLTADTPPPLTPAPRPRSASLKGRASSRRRPLSTRRGGRDAHPLTGARVSGSPRRGLAPAREARSRVVGPSVADGRREAGGVP